MRKRTLMSPALPIPLKRSETAIALCRATTASGQPCKAKPHKNGLCLLHSDLTKPAELGRKGGLRNRHVYDQPSEPVGLPESASDVKRMLAETMAEVKAGRMDPKVANTVAYVGTVLLRAYETDAARVAKVPTQPCVPLIYRSLTKDREPTEIYDYQTGKLIVSKPSALPPPSRRYRQQFGRQPLGQLGPLGMVSEPGQFASNRSRYRPDGGRAAGIARAFCPCRDSGPVFVLCLRRQRRIRPERRSRLQLGDNASLQHHPERRQSVE